VGGHNNQSRAMLFTSHCCVIWTIVFILIGTEVCGTFYIDQPRKQCLVFQAPSKPEMTLLIVFWTSFCGTFALPQDAPCNWSPEMYCRQWGRQKFSFRGYCPGGLGVESLPVVSRSEAEAEAVSRHCLICKFWSKKRSKLVKFLHNSRPGSWL